MCSKNRLNGSFFCSCHCNLTKLTASRTFSASLIALCEMLRVQKYKYPQSIPEPKRGSRISTRRIFVGSATNDGREINFWVSGTVIGYNKDQDRHIIRYDDNKTRDFKMRWVDWVYSDTINTASDNMPEEKIKAQIQQDYYKIMHKYGNLTGAITRKPLISKYSIVKWNNGNIYNPSCYILTTVL